MLPGNRVDLGTDDDPQSVTEELLVKAGRQLVAATQEDGEVVESQLGDSEPRRCAQREPQRRPRATAKLEVTEICHVPRVLGLGDLERPERDVVRGSVLAGGLIAA